MEKFLHILIGVLALTTGILLVSFELFNRNIALVVVGAILIAGGSMYIILQLYVGYRFKRQLKRLDKKFRYRS